MTKSSISADVTAANSKLAQFLRRQEEEEMILQIGKRKPKQLREEKRMPAGRARWSATPDFKVPTCMVDRPRTEAGATSFHFSFISISKEGVPTIKGQPVEGFSNRKVQPAVDHSKYIEREGAAEVSQSTNHAAYIERPGAVETLDPSALVQEAIERQRTALVNESPTEEEANILGVSHFAPDTIPSVFSNISDDPFERQEYWRAVERCEREPKHHEILLDPEVSPRWWASLPAATNLNPAFKNHALMVAAMYQRYLDQPAPLDEIKPPFIAPSFGAPGTDFKIDAERAGKIIEQAIAVPGFDHSLPPIEFKSGRGGRVQTRIVAELPYELTAEDRALVVQNFCDKISSLTTRIDPDGTERQVGMMHTAVIHAPDAHNDRRNYHLHIVAHDRPATYRPELGMWDFEYAEHFEIQRMMRVRYPLRQSKLTEVSRANGAADKSRAGINFIPALRKDFAEITNTVLKARGIKRRYDHRKYTEMGIERTPTEHLGTKAAALEAIGVPTTVGQLNAIAIWNDAERNIERQAQRSESSHKEVSQRLKHLAERATASVDQHPLLDQLRALIAERKSITESLAEDRRQIMVFDQLEAKAKSRAVRTRQTCLQYLADIENGTADNTTRMMQLQIQDRFKAAQAHIAQIDKSLAPHRAPLQAAAKDIELRERRLAKIDEQIIPVELELIRLAAITPTLGSKSEPAPSIVPTQSQVAGSADEDVEKEVDEAIVEPITIGGLPIAKGTISKPDRPKDLSTPEGLSPLRPETSKDIGEVEQTIPIDAPGANHQTKDQSSTKVEEESSKSIEKPNEVDRDAGAEKSREPKADGRRKQQDPTLFELPEQAPPVKAGTSKAEQTRWDDLLNRIAQDRIPIKQEETSSKKANYTVPSLSEDEKRLLATPRLLKRTHARLARIFESQQLEISRVLRWISLHGSDRNQLIMEGRRAMISKTQVISTLFGNWSAHPDVRAALVEEHNRRLEQDAERANPAKKSATSESSSKQREMEIARATYEDPKKVFSPEVRKFTHLLRELASEEELQEAADAIYENFAAREEVQSRSVALAVAYERYTAGRDSRLIQRARKGRERGD